MTSGTCHKHWFEHSIDLCRSCGHEFCAECLVYSFGERRPPFCVPCALKAAGVRAGRNGRGADGGHAHRRGPGRRFARVTVAVGALTGSLVAAVPLAHALA